MMNDFVCCKKKLIRDKTLCSDSSSPNSIHILDIGFPQMKKKTEWSIKYDKIWMELTVKRDAKDNDREILSPEFWGSGLDI